MISHGQTGLNVAFDLPTQMGLDSDDPLAEGEVGRVGMAVDSLRDFEVAFEGIPLDRIGAGLTINAVASIMLAMFQATAEKYGFPKDRVSATPQNDILKEMIGRGAWIFPVRPAVRLIGDTIEYAMKELPRTNPGQRLRLSHPGIRLLPCPGNCLCLSDCEYLYRRGPSAGATRSMISSGASPSISMSSETSGSRWPNSGRPENSGQKI